MAVDEKKIATFNDSLKEIPFSMRAFSISMRSLYAEKAVGGSDKSAVAFRELRDETRNDAMVYMHAILPICTKFITNLQEYFEYYLVLSFDQWCENLDDIVITTTEHQQVAELVVKLHKDILVTLKQREDKAKTILAEMTELTAEYEKKKEEFIEAANTKSSWAVALAFIPFVNVIATPLLDVWAHNDLVECVARCEEAKMHLHW